MAGAEVQLDTAGTALWLTDWQIDGLPGWTPRRVLAMVGGVPVGRLDFIVHPDGQALSVWGLEVEPAFRRRNLASAMMDALYAAHPTAWIDHGGRSLDAAHWWDRYAEPAPERNIHNRPPQEWAQYFEAPVVMAQRTRNAYQNRMNALEGHGAAEYRYGERLEAVGAQWASAYRPARAQGPDPAAGELHGGLRLVLPGELQQVMYDEGRDAAERAERLLNHMGHGNLPYAADWHTTSRAAFEDLAHAQVFDPAPAEGITHVAFRVRLAADQEVPRHEARATWVAYRDSPGIEVELTGVAWRAPQTPWVTHAAEFDRPIDAAIAPEYWRDASEQYTARFDEIGELRPGQRPRRAEAAEPFAGRVGDIAAMAAKLQEASHRRAVASLPEPTREVFEGLRGHQPSPAPQSPRLQ
ncbi:GNAT family N-acetyltransferase [Streptomyces zhihengii]|uniref:GNAT family N-acetyltransferase n=1 Tax=Streptomyces zhihengii TaxID=1818004 RepID=UPI0033BDEE16